MGEPIRDERIQQGSDGHDATRIRRRRHRAPTRSRGTARGRLRQIFFSVAAFWGFLAGVAAILVGLAGSGQRVTGGNAMWVAIAAALVIAVVGGMVAARAYRDVVSRSRG